MQAMQRARDSEVKHANFQSATHSTESRQSQKPFGYRRTSKLTDLSNDGEEGSRETLLQW
jgi:hypothetical protein